MSGGFVSLGFPATFNMNLFLALTLWPALPEVRASVLGLLAAVLAVSVVFTGKYSSIITTHAPRPFSFKSLLSSVSYNSDLVLSFHLLLDLPKDLLPFEFWVCYFQYALCILPIELLMSNLCQRVSSPLLSSKANRPALWPTLPPIQCVTRAPSQCVELNLRSLILLRGVGSTISFTCAQVYYSPSSSTCSPLVLATNVTMECKRSWRSRCVHNFTILNFV